MWAYAPPPSPALDGSSSAEGGTDRGERSVLRRLLILITRAVGVWATRVMRPGAELAAARQEAAALRDRLAAAEGDRDAAERELARLRAILAPRLDPRRPLDPDPEAPPYVGGVR